MTSERDIERILDHWFTERPTQVADRVLDEVADRIARQPQQPAWRVSRRDSHVYSNLKPLLAVAAIIVVAVAGFAVLRPSPAGIGGPPVSSSATPTAATAFPTPADSSWWQGLDSCGGCAGYLAAGSHTTRQFRPALTFTVPDGWINTSDAVDGIALIPNTDGNRLHEQTGSRTLHDLTVARNVAVGSSDCGDSSETGVGTTASDLAYALASRPGLVTSEPLAVSVGGLSGQQIDIALAADWTTPCPGEDIPQVALINFPQPGQGHFGVTAGERLRFIFLDVPAADGGGTLLVDVFAAPSDVFEQHLAAAMKVVDTFEFDLRP